MKLTKLGDLTKDELLEQFSGETLCAYKYENYSGNFEQLRAGTQSYIGSDLERAQLERKALGDFAKLRLSGSGAAVSASPQPRCPKCGYGSEKDEILPIYPPGIVAPNICVACPRCKFEVKVDVGKGTREFAHLVDFIEFFAAAPAQEPRMDEHNCPECGRWHSILKPVFAAPPAFECAARKAGTAGGNSPQDCDWPFCGCDPKADKVLEAIQELGYTLTKAAQEQPVDNSRSVIGAINGCGCVCHEVGLFGLMCCPCTKRDLDELVNGKRGTPMAPATTQGTPEGLCKDCSEDPCRCEDWIAEADEIAQKGKP